MSTIEPNDEGMYVMLFQKEYLGKFSITVNRIQEVKEFDEDYFSSYDDEEI